MDEFDDADLAAARQGDGAAFDRLIAPLRSGLHAHSYRMLGSSHDADDAVQEALLRAWKSLAGYRGSGSLRSWLYAVTTRVCLDAIAARVRRALPYDLGPASDQVLVDAAFRPDLDWLGPYQDDEGDVPAGPEARFEHREALELAFVAACQRLPGNQRAALLLFDVLGFTVAEIAMIMDTSTTAINSALARARRTLAADLPEPSQQDTMRKLGDARLRELVSGFASAMERADLNGMITLLTEDVSWSMPPIPAWYQGRRRVADFVAQVPLACGSWRCATLEVNAQPAVACYLRTPGDADHRAWSITALTLRDDKISAITSFLGEDHFATFGLPTRYPAG